MFIGERSTRSFKYKYIIYYSMENERGIRVSESLKNKIKRAALKNNMTMVAYLDSIVPEIKMDEVK